MHQSNQPLPARAPRSRNLFYAALLAIVPAASVADPGPHTARMMGTPASVFDMFLFRLYESAKCKIWLGEPEAQPDLCMTALGYDAGRDRLDLHFRMYPVNESLGDFVEVDDDRREIIMAEALDRVAKLAGASSDWGMLHSIPIRNGWSGDDLDEGAFRKELADRTVVHLHVTYGSGVYTATREIGGGVMVEMTKRRVDN